MKTRKEYTERYNTLAKQLGVPTVSCLFRTTTVARERVEKLEAQIAGQQLKMAAVQQVLGGSAGTQAPAAPPADPGDPGDIPACLRVSNRKPLTPEEIARIEEMLRAAGASSRKRKRDFYQPKGMSDEEWAAHKQAKDKEVQTAKKARLQELRRTRSGGTPKSPGSTGSRSVCDGASVVVALVQGNPHRPTAKDHGKWEKTMAAGTVGKALATGVEIGYIRYAAGRGLLRIDPPATK